METDPQELRDALLGVVEIAVAELRKLGLDAKLESAQELDKLEKKAEELVARFEQACELHALSILVGAEVFSAGLSKMPDGAGALEQLLKKRGVL